MKMMQPKMMTTMTTRNMKTDSSRVASLSTSMMRSAATSTFFSQLGRGGEERDEEIRGEKRRGEGRRDEEIREKKKIR